MLSVSVNKVEVSPELFTRWVETAVSESLTGYTDSDEKTGLQYRVVHFGPDQYKVEATYPQRESPRVFLVSVKVTEVKYL